MGDYHMSNMERDFALTQLLSCLMDTDIELDGAHNLLVSENYNVRNTLAILGVTSDRVPRQSEILQQIQRRPPGRLRETDEPYQEPLTHLERAAGPVNEVDSDHRGEDQTRGGTATEYAIGTPEGASAENESNDDDNGFLVISDMSERSIVNWTRLVRDRVLRSERSIVNWTRLVRDRVLRSERSIGNWTRYFDHLLRYRRRLNFTRRRFGQVGPWLTRRYANGRLIDSKVGDPVMYEKQ